MHASDLFIYNSNQWLECVILELDFFFIVFVCVSPLLSYIRFSKRFLKRILKNLDP